MIECSVFSKVAPAYTIFALIATAANIGAQDLVTRVYNGLHVVPVSVFIGTGIGLMVKYALDRRYIFRFRARNVAHNTLTFALYAVFGLVTTVVFWAFEFGFQQAFGTAEMRYLGGVIGLAVGYVSKYQLDKRYVFKKTPD